MSCQEVVARLSDYIDGTLDTGTRKAVEEHLDGCRRCHLVLDSTQCTILLSRAAQSASLSVERRAELVRRLERLCRDCGGRRDPTAR